MQTEQVIVARLLAAPLEKVWQALTDCEKMKQWYFDLPDFRAEAGCAFQFYGGTPEKQFLHLCVVTEVVHLKKIAYSWRYDGYAGVSHVAFELFQEDGGTRLLLTHTGLDSFPADVPELASHNFAAGWNHIIHVSLPAFVEQS